MKTKICSKCKVEKPLDQFYNRKISKDGKESQCKECTLLRSKIYRDNNVELSKARSKKYRDTHKEDIQKRCTQYYLNNRESILKRTTQYTKDHPDIRRKCKQNDNAKRRNWEEPLPINEWFEGSHLHHLHIKDNHQVCIYILVDLHTSVRHAYNKPKTMNEINELAMEWYYKC